jgi:TRAP-type mannitol/chloroaromatic compound transport system permease large subunit
MTARISLAVLLSSIAVAAVIIVIGTIFFGIATATESAAVGIVGALVNTAWRLTLAMLREVCEATVRTKVMVVAILVGAFFLNIVIQAIGLKQQLSRLIAHYQISRCKC